MRSVSSEVPSRAGRGRRRPDSALSRKATLRRAALESLEPRTLLAVLPPPQVQAPVDVTGQRGIEFQPTIAVDPTNPLKAVVVYSEFDPVNNPTSTSFDQAAFTTNGGQTWRAFAIGTGFLIDPNSSNTNPQPFNQIYANGVDFDRNGNFYIVGTQYPGAFNAANLPSQTNLTGSGAIVLNKYSFGATPALLSSRTVYEFASANDPVFNPTIAVDHNLPTFTDTNDSNQTVTQTDPNVGNIYIAWASNDVPQAGNPLGTNFNPNRIAIVASTDGGNTFSTIEYANDPGNVGSQRNTTPKLVVSQGTADGRVAGGQVSLVWTDTGTLANANPPRAIVFSDRITDVPDARPFQTTPGPIKDATDPGNGAPHIPAPTDFPFNVDLTGDNKFDKLSDLDITINAIHPNLAELSIVLIPPSGTGLPTVTLLRNQTDAAGNTNTGRGAGGANLGQAPVGQFLGTIFDDQAARDIVDINPFTGARGAAAPFVGHFRSEGDLFGQGLDALVTSVQRLNLTPAQLRTLLSGTWTLEITDFRNSGTLTPPVPALVNATLNFRSGLDTTTDSQVATPLRNFGPLTNSPGVPPLDQAPVLASDNTLGAFSPFQGRLYAAFVDRTNDPLNTNPVDNTDIILSVSDDGGVSWRRIGKVNDDNATTDGFSEDNASLNGGPALSGRPQFQPQVAVDQSTGELVMSWYDTRYSGDRNRPTYFIGYSVDGGATFAPQTYVNPSRTATDAVTGKTVVVEPLSDNFTATANGQTNQVATTGFHQGLAVASGRVYAAWSSNLDRVVSGTDAGEDIRVAPALITNGPRIIASTMGPVGEPGDTVNNQRTADGTPIASSFVVTFDRPIDPNTFKADDVRVFFTDTLPGNPSGGPVPVLNVTPLNLGFFGPNNAHGATRFRVDFAPRSAVGTYSYTVGPGISDRIRSSNPIISAGQTTVFNAQGNQVNLPIPIDNPTGNPNGDTGGPNSPATNSTIQVSGIPANQLINKVTVTLSINHTFDSDLVIDLIAPDNSVITLSNQIGQQQVFFGGTNFVNTTFDDNAARALSQGTDPFTGTFRPDGPGQLTNLRGISPNGTWTLRIRDVQAVDVGKLIAWSLSIQTGVLVASGAPGNQMDQNGDGIQAETPGDIYAAPRPINGVQPNGTLAAPFDQDTLPLIIPGPHVASTHVPGAPVTADNLVLNGTVNALDVTFDRDMDPSTFTPDKVLRIIGPAGLVNLGPNGSNVTVTPNPLGTDPDPAHPRTYRVGFPVQQLSGTYVINLASSIKSKIGDALDTNLNAGVDLLKGVASTGQTAPVTFSSTDTPAPIPDTKQVSSQITVTDNFVIQGVSLSLNITHPNDPDLQAFLIAPDGITKIQLFTHIGATGTHANFTNTTFDDNAFTLIQNGGPPFNGTFKPQQALSVLNGRLSAGTYTLVIQDDTAGNVGTLNSWSLTLRKPLPPSDLGEPTADVASSSFRIFTMDPTNPLASNTWTSVGPASIGNSTGGRPSGGVSGGASGRVGGLAVDPSDPSGNTVYVGGASGGIWKTTDFLNPQGPTYIPLTDFGPTFGINIGGIAVFGRNNDPNQSIVFAATGEGDTGSTGVGFLRSMDGGATWTLLDSTDNSLPFAQRDHLFAKNGGTQSFKIVADPVLGPSGVVVYAAISGANGGLWRSDDSGVHWQNMRPGQATDLVLDPNSAAALPNGQKGNLQFLYAGFRGEGVFFSPNRGQVFNLMTGGIGDPQIVDRTRNVSVAVSAPSDTPNGAKGRIVLAKPALTGNPAQDLIYQGWLYAGVITPDSHEDGLYMTKDFGQNWVKLGVLTLPPLTATAGTAVLAVPTNDPTNGHIQYDIGGGPAGSGLPAQGNYDVSLAVDPTNPNIAYLGGTADGQPTGFVRVDATLVNDAHSLTPFSTQRADNGLLLRNSTGGIALDDPINIAPPTPFINLIRNPNQPFVNGSTIFTTNTARFVNDGTGVKWTPFDIGGTDQHRIITEVDPLTGHARIIIGDDQGVFSAVDNNGVFSTGIGTSPFASGSRNGNLQITQFYYGAVQPSNLAAQIAGALFVGSAQDNGGPASDPNILTNGNLSWDGPGGDATGVATDQQGLGTVYQYFWPCCGGNSGLVGNEFFRVNGVARTFGLLQANNAGPVPDPQWPYTGGFNFAVNPLNGDQVIMGSAAGRLFGTENQGRVWAVIGNPGALDGSVIQAPAYGAPDPNGPGGGAVLDNFLYVGTTAGHIFVTQTGGGGNGNSWTDISAGLDGSAVQAIVTNPTRGSHEAYAVTLAGVYHIDDSLAAGATWQNITGDLFQQMHNPFGDPTFAEDQARYLTSLAADWRYVIPDNLQSTSGPTHPMLYVGGEGGVFRSSDNGQTWILFPSQDPNSFITTPTPPGDGGGLPVAHVTDLDLSLGNIDPTTGRPNVSTGPNILAATTFGRGVFAIRLAPVVFPQSLALDPSLPAPGGSDSGSSKTDRITNVVQPVFDGLSEQSAFGQVVTVNLIDLTNPNNPVVIGTGQTDANGRFAIQVNAGVYKADGSTDGVKTIGVQAVDQAGTKGNIALITFTLDTTPPQAPSIPDLTDASDTGISNTDNITSVTAPIFNIATAEPTTIVQLIRDGAVVATRTGPGPIKDPGPVPDGVHLYRARQVDIAGNVGALSNTLSVTIDTVPPANPAAPTLLAADDTGIQGDNVTSVQRPHLVGSSEPGGLVLLLDAAGNIVGSASVASNGTYSVQPASNLTDGTYTFRIRAEDIAGNFSKKDSTGLTITILTKTPAVPTLALVATDDTGVPGDNITNIRRPRVTGRATANLAIDLIAGSTTVGGVLVSGVTLRDGTVLAPGTVIVSGIVAPDGSYVLQFPSDLADGPQPVNVRVRDVAGNTSTSDQIPGTPNVADPLVITIDTTPPSTVPTLILADADDTGVKGDNVTSIRRPHFTGKTDNGVFVDLVDSSTGLVLGSTVSSSSNGSFTLQLPSDLSNGSITLQARVRDVAGNAGTPSAPLTLKTVTIPGDFDSDGKADLVSYSQATGQWTIHQSATGTTRTQLFGAPNLDIPLLGDFDGDGKSDLAVYRPSAKLFIIARSRSGPEIIPLGQLGDIPFAADFDGDGVTDPGVYHPATGQWTIIESSAGLKTFTFGSSLDTPIPADYDGDGKADLALYRKSAGLWIIVPSGGGPGRIVPFGAKNLDVPVPADYDGDGKADLALYRPTGTPLYIILPSGGGPGRIVPIGQVGDIPAPLDYNGDGKADPAVFHPATAQFFIQQQPTQSSGRAGDVPVAAPYDYRKLKGIVGAARALVTQGGSAPKTSAFNFGATASGFGRS